MTTRIPEAETTDFLRQASARNVEEVRRYVVAYGRDIVNVTGIVAQQFPGFEDDIDGNALIQVIIGKVWLSHQASMSDSQEVKAMHERSLKRMVIIVELLSEQGCDVNYRMKSGKTALHHAFHIPVREILLQVVNALLAHKADVCARDNEGNLPLDEIKYGIGEIYKPDFIPLFAAVCPEYQERLHASSLFLQAASERNLAEVQRLFSTYGREILNASGEVEQTLPSGSKGFSQGNALIHAIFGRVFLAFQANMSTHLLGDHYHGKKEEYDNSQKEMVKVVDFLVKQGCNVNHRIASGKTALHFAFHITQLDILTEVVGILLANGADVCASDDEGHFPLDDIQRHIGDEYKPLFVPLFETVCPDYQVKAAEAAKKAAEIEQVRHFRWSLENKIEKDDLPGFIAMLDQNPQLAHALYQEKDFFLLPLVMGKFEFIRVLLERDAPLPPNVLNLALSSGKNLSQMLEVLLTKADPNERVGEQSYSWHQYALLGEVDCVRQFLSRGVDVEAKSEGLTIRELLGGKDPKLQEALSSFKKNYEAYPEFFALIQDYPYFEAHVIRQMKEPDSDSDKEFVDPLEGKPYKDLFKKMAEEDDFDEAYESFFSLMYVQYRCLSSLEALVAGGNDHHKEILRLIEGS